MTDETVHICEACGQIVDPAEPGIVRAVELVDATTMGRRDVIEGRGVYFHAADFPVASREYRRQSRHPRGL